MIPTRSITHTISIQASQAEVFNALIAPSMIKRWWGASSAVILAEPGGIYALTWGEDEDNPDYITVARINRFEPPVALGLDHYQYRSKDGLLPFDNDLPVLFELSTDAGTCVLTVRQVGFPTDADTDMYYEGCVKGWAETLEGIQNVVEGAE